MSCLGLFERKREGRPHSQFAADADPLAVGLDDMLDDRQSEARAALLARTSLVRTVEPLENTGYVLLGDTDTVVLDLDEDLVQHVAELDPRQTTLLAVTDRVDDQIDQHMSDKMLVGADPERRRQAVGPLHES